MKNIFLLLAISFLVVQCGDDDGGDGILLRHDGDNATAPFLPAGIHEAAARFSDDVISNFSGQQLTEVEYFVEEIPQEIEIIVYEGGQTEPSSIIQYSAIVTSEASTGRFNTHELTTPVTLGTNSIWIAVRMVINGEDTQVIGCDNGSQPNPNGDWIDFLQRGWDNFSNVNPGETINWNIRGRVE